MHPKFYLPFAFLSFHKVRGLLHGLDVLLKSLDVLEGTKGNVTEEHTGRLRTVFPINLFAVLEFSGKINALLKN